MSRGAPVRGAGRPETATISRATSSLGSSNVGRMMPPLTMRKLR
jgi:hypothetical protein